MVCGWVCCLCVVRCVLSVLCVVCVCACFCMLCARTLFVSGPQLVTAALWAAVCFWPADDRPGAAAWAAATATAAASVVGAA